MSDFFVWVRVFLLGYLGYSASVNVFGIESFLLALLIGGVTWVAFEFFWGYVSSKIMMKRLSDVPPLGQLLPEIEKHQRRMTKWEHDFFLNIQEKVRTQPKFLSERATMKQINILFQIYAERVRRVKLKGLTYELQLTDEETGEIREITNVSRSGK